MNRQRLLKHNVVSEIKALPVSKGEWRKKDDRTIWIINERKIINWNEEDNRVEIVCAKMKDDKAKTEVTCRVDYFMDNYELVKQDEPV
jgi:hypothetical protein